MADLRPYRAKRRFDVTAEPKGGEGVARADAPTFVVQKHAARRLHYDFRLEIGGALRSWAVPEGPSLDTKVRRLAVQTEDHPMEYGGFEGAIPSGEYGAGHVIVWDRGTWVTLATDVEAALAAGELKFRLMGEKLRGGWTLVKLPKDPKAWLLIKERDDEVRAAADYDVLQEAPRSVLSGLTVEELAATFTDAAPPTPARKARRISASRVPGAKPAPLPALIAPQLAHKVEAPVAGGGWGHEIKYDGYRTIARIDGGQVQLFTRNQHDWTHRYRAVAKALGELDCKSAIIDGEIVVQDARGVTSIALLEAALSEGRDAALTYFAFDLIHLDGYDLSACKLSDRKKALAGLMAPQVNARSALQISDHQTGDAGELFAHACRLGLEGIVSKRLDAPYVQARSKTWVKLKRAYVGAFTVIGFTTTAPGRVAALILAEDKGDGALTYVGRVSSGLTDASAEDLFKHLSKRPLDAPVTVVPKTPNARWAAPTLTANVAFNSRAPDGAPRQPVLLGVTPQEPPKKAVMRKLVTDRDLAAIRLTNPEREVFAGSGVTKLDIAIYYARVGDWMLPELLRRPTSLIRCPTGALKDCFYQRHAFAGLPEGVGAIALSEEEERTDFIYVETALGFLALAQFGAIEFHPWGCRVDDPEHPDRLAIDLDPDPSVGWPQVRAAAEMLRDRLTALGLEPFVRTTGGKGLHLVCAIKPGSADWPTLRGFAEAFARSAAKDAPQAFTSSPSKDARKGRIYIDYLRNARGASAVASYSLRANTDFTVATPVTWSELRNLEGPRAFDRKSVLNRLSRLGKDPWDGLEKSASPISAKAKRDVGMK